MVKENHCFGDKTYAPRSTVVGINGAVVVFVDSLYRGIVICTAKLCLYNEIEVV